MSMTATHLREYWIVKRDVAGKRAWLAGYDTWSTNRGAAEPYYDSETAHEDAKEHGATVVHVTITTVPKGQRAAWERVVRAAVAMCTAFEAGKRSLDPFVTCAPVSITDLDRAVNALGAHRPVAK